MGHSAAEMGYETPQERHDALMARIATAQLEFENNDYKPTVGDRVSFTGLGYTQHSLYISFLKMAGLGLIVRRTKNEDDGNTYISFMDEVEAEKHRLDRSKKSPLQLLVSDEYIGTKEWFDARYFNLKNVA